MKIKVFPVLADARANLMALNQMFGSKGQEIFGDFLDILDEKSSSRILEDIGLQMAKTVLCTFEPSFCIDNRGTLKDLCFTMYLHKFTGELYQHSVRVKAPYDFLELDRVVDETLELKSPLAPFEPKAVDYSDSFLGYATQLIQNIIAELNICVEKLNSISYALQLPWATNLLENQNALKALGKGEFDTYIRKENKETLNIDQNEVWGDRFDRVDSNELLENIYANITTLIIQSFSNAHQAAYNYFLSGIDLEKISSFSMDKEPDIMLYNWLINDPHNYRAQAFNSFPLVMIVALNQSCWEPSLILDAVDQANSLTLAIEQQWGLPRIAVQNLRGVEYKESITSILEKVIGFNRCKEQWKLLEKRLGSKHWPNASNPAKISDQWECFFNFFKFTEIFAIRDKSKHEDYNFPVLWQDSSIPFTQGDYPWKHTNSAISITYTSNLIFEIRDTINRFSTDILLPIVMDIHPKAQLNLNSYLFKNVQASGLIYEIIFTRYHLISDILLISKIWHRDQFKMQSNLGNEEQWLGLFPNYCKGNLSAQALCSPAQLREEAIVLNHCVNTYTSKCKFQPCHIISIRLDGIKTSTLELEEQENCVRIVQHQAYGNTDVSEEVSVFATELVNAMNTGSLKIDWNAISKSRNDRNSRGNSLSSLIDYPWQDISLRERAFENWKFALPRYQKVWSYSEWLEKNRIKEWIAQDIAQAIECMNQEN